MYRHSWRPFWTCHWDLPISLIKLSSGTYTHLGTTLLKYQIIKISGLSEVRLKEFCCILVPSLKHSCCSSLQGAPMISYTAHGHTMMTCENYAAWMIKQNLKMTQIKSWFHIYIKPTSEMKKVDDFLHPAAWTAWQTHHHTRNHTNFTKNKNVRWVPMSSCFSVLVQSYAIMKCDREVTICITSDCYDSRSYMCVQGPATWIQTIYNDVL
jgi:hypothetical protein